MSRGIVFDLDDTLYLERDYVRSGFSFIADLMAKRTSVEKEEVFSCLWGLFLQGERGNIFDQCLARYPCLQEQFSIQELVTAYRGHIPAIKMFAPLKIWLQNNRDRFYLGVISDGPLKSQQAKVKSLGVNELIPDIILTDTWGREFWKPHPLSFEFLAKEWGLENDQLVYIGDNPSKDFIAPKRLGWRTIRLKIQGQLHYDKQPLNDAAAPDYVLNSVQELIEMINGL